MVSLLLVAHQLNALLVVYICKWYEQCWCDQS